MALPCGAMGLLQFVIVVFPDHTHLLFLRLKFSLPRVFDDCVEYFDDICITHID